MQHVVAPVRRPPARRPVRRRGLAVGWALALGLAGGSARAAPVPRTIQAQWVAPVPATVAHSAHPARTHTEQRSARVAEGRGAPGTARIAAVEALARGDALGALSHLGTLPAPERGAARVEVEVLRAQALWALGRYAEADAAYGRAAEADPKGRHLPGWFLPSARARLALEWAPRIPEPARRREVVARGLAAVRRALARRDLPDRPVLDLVRVELLAQAFRDAEPAARKAAARRLARAAGTFLERYPNAPRAPEVALLEAEAVAASKGPRAGLSALRRVARAWVGAPAAEDARRLAERLAAEHGLSLPRPSRSERLEDARTARRLRWYDASRRILDDLLAEPGLPPGFRRSVLRERAYTAYRQRDYARCAVDLRPLYERTVAVYGELVRCLERAHQYDEALAVVLGRAKSVRGRRRAGYVWQAVELAFRGGMYERTLELLADYEALSRGHPTDRAFYRGMALLRLGRADEAVAHLERYARGASERTRARYLVARAKIGSGDAAVRDAGYDELEAIAGDLPFRYYGIWARAHLRAAGRAVPALPRAERPAAYRDRPSLADVVARLDGLAAEFGEALPALSRARTFLAAGVLEEARREVRLAARTVRALSARIRGGRVYGPKSEALGRGLSWRREFRVPRLRYPRGLRAVLRDEGAAARLREGLFVVALGLDEPYDALRLGPSDGDPFGMRWNLRAYRREVEAAAARWGFDPSHLWALMYTESRFRRFVVSPVGARGAVQIMPYTARRLAERLGWIPVGGVYDPDRLYDIEENTKLAAYYLAELAVKFHGQMPMAYASYNGGPHNVARWVVAKTSVPAPLDLFVEEIPFRETRRYVRRVMETQARYVYLATGDLPLWHGTLDPRVRRNIDF